MIEIHETISSLSAGIIFAIIFLSILFYMSLSGREERIRYKRMKKAKMLIEEGHKKAMNGSRYDGIFKETRRNKYQEEIDLERQREVIKECGEKARQQARSDIRLLRSR